MRPSAFIIAVLAVAFLPGAPRAEDFLRGPDFSHAAEALRVAQSTDKASAPNTPATGPSIDTGLPASAAGDAPATAAAQVPSTPPPASQLPEAQPRAIQPASIKPPVEQSTAGASKSSGGAGCPADRGRLAVSRIVDIDTSGGPIFGEITRRAREPSFLKPKEVVLTFDDGPMPWITRSILDTLDRYCAKATFFEVGRMAVAYPYVTREVLARGHTVGGHTWSHPFNLPHMKPEKAHDEIEKGLAAVSLAAGGPIAPFFRFTGLGDSDPLLAYLQKRGIASFTVDVVSDDSYINDSAKLARVTLERIESHKGGIVLFHDIKAATAKALPVILAALSERGYTIVHMRAKEPLKPLHDYDAGLAHLVDRAMGSKQKMLPFFGTVGPERAPQVTALAPEPRVRSTQQPASRAALSPRHRATTPRGTQSGLVVAQPDGWATEVRPNGRSSARRTYPY